MTQSKHRARVLAAQLAFLLSLLPIPLWGQIESWGHIKNDFTKDIRDPRAFVLIWETDRKDAILPLLTNSASNGDIAVSEVLDAEVDIRSRINIEFNETLIRAHAADFDANLTITAQLKSADTIRDIKVDGYSTVQEGTTQPAVRLRSAAELLPVLRNLKAELDKRVSLPNRLTFTLREVLVQPADTSAADDQLEKLRDSLDTEDIVIRAALTKVSDAKYRPVLNALAKMLGKDADTLVEEAKQGLVVLDRVAKDRADQKLTPPSAIRPLYAAIAYLAPLAEIDEGKSYGYMLAALKSGGILVSQVGAKVGDQITLTIKNGSDSEPEGIRRKSFQYRVGQFGWNRSIADSALLIYRLGIGVGDNAAAVSAGKNVAKVSGQPVTVESPDRLNYAPAPGVTLGLTWVVRRSDDFGGKVVRFLEPGIGINVSFPQFSSTVTHIVPAATGEPTVTVDSSKRPIDVSAGAVVGFWDNAVQFTYGWNLNADSRRTYIGIGFGFVKVLEKIKSLAGS